MKKILIFLGVLLLTSTAHAATILFPYQGGTGTGSVPSSGMVLIGNSSGTYTPAYISAGTNITITTSSGGITIESTGGSGSGTVGPGTSTQIAVFNTSSSITSYAGLTFDSTSTYLGIGTTTPAYLLHGFSNVSTSSDDRFYLQSNGSASLWLQGDASGASGEPGNAYVYMNTDNNTHGAYVFQAQQLVGDGTTYDPFNTGGFLSNASVFGSRFDDPVQLAQSSTPVMTIDTSGNIGVGITSSISALLHTKSVAGVVPMIIEGTDTSTSTRGGNLTNTRTNFLRIFNNDAVSTGTFAGIQFGQGAYSTSRLQAAIWIQPNSLTSNGTSDLYLGTKGAAAQTQIVPRITIAGGSVDGITAGRVGIGTPLPSSTLHVIGNGQFSTSLVVDGLATLSGGLTVSTTGQYSSAIPDTGGQIAHYFKTDNALTSGGAASGNLRKIASFRSQTNERAYIAADGTIKATGLYVGLEPLDVYTGITRFRVYNDSTLTSGNQYGIWATQQKVNSSNSTLAMRGILFNVNDVGSADNYGIQYGAEFASTIGNGTSRLITPAYYGGVFSAGFSSTGVVNTTMSGPIYTGAFSWQDFNAAGSAKTVNNAGFLRMVYDPSVPSVMNGAYTTFRGLEMDLDFTRASSTNIDAIYIASQTANSSPTKGNIKMNGGDWNTGHLQLNTGHMWYNSASSSLRFSTTAPTATTTYALAIETSGASSTLKIGQPSGQSCLVMQSASGTIGTAVYVYFDNAAVMYSTTTKPSFCQ